MTNENFSDCTLVRFQIRLSLISENAFVFPRSRANFPADVHGAESDAMTINSDSSM